MLEVLTRRGIAWPELESLHQEIVQKVKETKAPYLLLSEPKATLTRGRSAADSDLLVSPAQLLENGIEAHSVSRGGKWTYHGPGQIVGYPILHLPSLGYDEKAVQPYLRILRDSVASVLTQLGLKIEFEDKPYGIFCNKRKIVSFGIHLSQGVTSHGFALYLQDQRPAFQFINPCGVAGHQPTSLEEQGIAIGWSECADLLVNTIQNSLLFPEKLANLR